MSLVGGDGDLQKDGAQDALAAQPGRYRIIE